LVIYAGLHIYQEYELFDINSAAAYRMLPCALS